MDRAIYTAMVAARQTLEMQAVNANNLANAASNGYRAQLSACEQYLSTDLVC